jgi:Major intrinsic protein
MVDRRVLRAARAAPAKQPRICYWNLFWVYVVGPVVGAGVGALAYQVVRGEHAPAQQEGSSTGNHPVLTEIR